MDKKVVNERFNEVIRQIKSNSKDTHFAEKLIDDFKAIHREKISTPLRTFELGEELERIEKGSFYIAKHEYGALFHIYNSIDLVVPLSQNSLFGTLMYLVEKSQEEEYNKMTNEEKREFDTYLECVGLILAMQTWLFSDVEFTFKIGTQICDYMRVLYEGAISKELRDETPKEDATFRDTVANMKEDANDFVESLGDSLKAMSE